MDTELERIVFGIITHAGDAKAYAYEALKKAEEHNFNDAEEMLKKSDEEMLKAHAIQTDIIQKEAQGNKIEVCVLFVHAQDHLMTAMSEKNLIIHLIKLYKVLYENISKPI